MHGIAHVNQLELDLVRRHRSAVDSLETREIASDQVEGERPPPFDHACGHLVIRWGMRHWQLKTRCDAHIEG